ncbi:MAG: DUF4386 family protein [Christensenellales bacterium]
MEQDHQDAYLEKWRLLLRIAGFSTILICVIIPVQIAAFAIWRLPDSVIAWFTLYRANWLLGLIHQDLLYVINNLLVAVMYLALYVLLRNRNESLMIIAMLLGFLGISAYLGSNKSFEMMQLSGLYFGAGSEMERTMALAAGQAMLSGWGGTAFDIYYILNGIALILISIVMLRSSVFTRSTAIIGLVSGGLMMIPSTAGTIGLAFSLLSLIPWYVFSVLAAKQFFTISRLPLRTGCLLEASP